MLTSLALARRIRSRLARISGAHASDAVATGRDALVDLTSDGCTYRARVSPLFEHDPLPATCDPIDGEPARVNQIRLAQMASDGIRAMAKVCQHPEEIAQLRVRHANGRAGFVARCTFGGRFLVEVSEVKPKRRSTKARAA